MLKWPALEIGLECYIAIYVPQTLEFSWVDKCLMMTVLAKSVILKNERYNYFGLHFEVDRAEKSSWLDFFLHCC